MTHQHHDDQERRIGEALTELRELIRHRYPAATFETYRGEDPDGTYLRVTVDIEDPDAVLDAVLDRLFALQVEEALPVYVVPTWPIERVAEYLATRKRRGGALSLPPALPL